MAKRVFKIRRMSDGLFSNGGWWPGFTKDGKVWTTRGGLRQHLRNIEYLTRELNPYEPYVDSEIVVIEVTHREVSTHAIQEAHLI